MSKNLNEEIIRMRQIFNFKISDNAHDVLSDEFTQKSLIKEQDNVLGPSDDTETAPKLPTKEMVAELKGMPASNENIKSAMKAAIGTYGDHTIIDNESFSAVWGVWPNLGKALSVRADLKSMWNYYDKAGQLALKMMNVSPGWNNVLPTVNGGVITRNSSTGEFLAFTSPEAFIKDFNKLTLQKWANNKKYYYLGYDTSVLEGSPARTINFVVSKINPKFNGPYYGPNFYNKAEWKWEIKGQKYAADFMVGSSGDNFLKDQDGGPDVIKVLTNIVDIEKLKSAPAPGKSAKKYPIKYVSYLEISPVFSNLNIIFGYHQLVAKGEKTKNIVADKTDIDIKPIKIKDYMGTSSVDGGGVPITFKTGKFDGGSAPLMKDWITNEINSLETYINSQLENLPPGEKVTLNMGPITLTSSASNSWNKKTLKPLGIQTHTNFGTGDAGSNNELAYNRGNTMITAFKDALDTAKAGGRFKNINFADDMVIQWQIADTGGKVDTDPTRDASIPKGQWVKVTVGGGGKGTKTIETTTPGATIRTGESQLNTVQYKYSPSPGIMKWHPNKKKSKVVNSIFGFLGLTRTDAQNANYAEKHGA